MEISLDTDLSRSVMLNIVNVKDYAGCGKARGVVTEIIVFVNGGNGSTFGKSVTLNGMETEITQTVENGERIAQMVIGPYLRPEFVEVDDLSDTERGDGGFGHTGK